MRSNPGRLIKIEGFAFAVAVKHSRHDCRLIFHDDSTKLIVSFKSLPQILTSFFLYVIDPNESIQDHESRIHEINTLEWDELVVPEDHNQLIAPEAGNSFCIASRLQ